jgi:branched-chain amino acid transport system substrate-binding protein
MVAKQSSGERLSRRTVLKMSGVGVGAAGIAGCVGMEDDGGDNGNDTGSDGGDDTGSTDNDGGTGLDTVTLGFLIPISGPIASLGAEMEASIGLAVEQINAGTGLDLDFEIETAVRDTETDTSTAVRQADRLVSDDGADVIVGPIESGTSFAVSDWATDEEILVAPASSSVALTGADCNEYTFRAETHSGQVAEGGAEWVVDNLGADVWFHIADYAYGQSVREEWGTRVEANGATIVGETAPAQGTENFEPQISQIRDADPDVVIMGSAGADLFNFMGQAAQQGLTQETNLFGDSSVVQLTRNAIGMAAVNTYGMARFNPTFDDDRMRRFVEAWREETGRIPGNFSRTGYQTVTMVAQGIQAAGTTEGDALSDTLEGLPVETFFGETQFRACDHQSVNPVWVAEFVQPGEGDLPDPSDELPDIKYLDYASGEDAVPACEDVGCDLG